MATDRRGSEHTRIRTLVVEEKQRFTSEVEPLDDSEYWEGHDEPRDSREKITFRSDLTNLVFGSDPEVQLVESRLALQDIGAPVAKVVENETALEAQGPIRHLIMRVDPQSLVEALLPLRPRLRRDSTIVLLPKGMGISEMLNEKVFPDPETRPNYVMADVRHSLMSVQNGSISTVSDVSSLAMLKLAAGGDPGTARFGFHHLHKGAFTISPVVQFSGESPSQYNARKRSAMFITGLLLGAPDLNARFLPAEDHRAARYLHTIVEAIVHPLTVFYNCTIQDIKLGDKRNRHLDRLIREVVPIVQPDLKRVTYDWLTRRVGDYITNRGDKVPVMLNRVGRGQRTSVDVRIREENPGHVNSFDVSFPILPWNRGVSSLNLSADRIPVSQWLYSQKGKRDGFASSQRAPQDVQIHQKRRSQDGRISLRTAGDQESSKKRRATNSTPS